MENTSTPQGTSSSLKKSIPVPKQSRIQDNESSEEQERSKIYHFNTCKKAEDDTGEKQVAEDDLEAYRCMIIEEQPSSPNDI